MSGGANKERRRKDAGGPRVGFRGGVQLRNRSSWEGRKKGKKDPAGGLENPAGMRTGRISRIRISPQPSSLPHRQAGFTAARPAANWIRSSRTESRWIGAHNLEAIGLPCLVRTVDVKLRPGADCGPGDWHGGFPPCA